MIIVTVEEEYENAISTKCIRRIVKAEEYTRTDYSDHYTISYKDITKEYLRRMRRKK